MFKKTLLALALTATATTAFAATITPGADVLSRQAIASDTNVAMTTSGPGIAIALAAEYAVNDIITIAVAGATIDTTTSAPTLVDGTAAITLGVLTTTTSSITFRVTAIGGGTTVGVSLLLNNVDLNTASVVASDDVEIAFSAQTANGFSLDTNETESVFTVVDEYSSVATDLDGIIDVNNGRQQFTVGPLTDALVLTPTTEAVLLAATYVGSTYTVTGDFSFLDVDADGAVDAGELADAAVTVTDDTVTTKTLNVAMTELVVVTAEGANNSADTVTVTFTVEGAGTGNPVLSVQTFTADSAIRYTDTVGTAGSLATQTAENVGSWTINGSQINFPYAPVGYDTITTQFEIANSGAQNGEISVTAFDTAGNDYSAVLPQVAEAGKLTKIGFADLTTAFGLATGTKLSLTITVAAPAADIKITGYSNIDGGGRMALLSNVYEGI